MPRGNHVGDVTKLPVWAQELLKKKDREISDLQGSLEATRALLERRASDALAPKWQEQVAFLDPYHDKLPIGDGHVRYELSSRDWINVRYRSENRVVEVSGERSILVAPQSGNVIQIHLESR